VNLHPQLHIAIETAHTLLALLCCVHILFKKRQPLSALVWMFIVCSAPFAGFFLYWYFGVNRVESGPRKASPGGPPTGRAVAAAKLPSTALDRLGLSLTGLSLHRGCRVRLLKDGAEAYPAMLASIASARESVDLLTYIFDMDQVGLRFVQALEAAAGRGVRVRVLVDGIGAWFPGGPLRKRLSAAGVLFSSFWRTESLFHQPLLNLRNHRKLLVVDAVHAYVGSLNISERHYKGPLALHPLRRLRRRKASERDLHFRIQGAVIQDLAMAFQYDWESAGEKPVPQRGLRPGPAGNDAVRLVRSGPDGSFERIYELLLGALRLARHEVDLCTPYFIPDGPLMAMLRSLALSGVRVRLFVPRLGDTAMVTWASRAYFRELVAAGVEIWEIEGSFVHSKACVIDGQWCLVGSCNLDPRSFRLNFELNLEVRSRRLARQIKAVLEGYRSQARQVDLSFLRGRGFVVRLRDNAAKLFSPYL
jgi:cardiolipin synthase